MGKISDIKDGLILAIIAIVAYYLYNYVFKRIGKNMPSIIDFSEASKYCYANIVPAPIMPDNADIFFGQLEDAERNAVLNSYEVISLSNYNRLWNLWHFKQLDGYLG